MASYEALYRRKCQSPLYWTELSKRTIIGPDLVDITRKIDLIKQKLLIVESRQKSYADFYQTTLEFDVGDHVFLKVSPLTSIGRSIKAKMLTLRFIGPYEILERIGPVACRIALPSYLSNIHNAFHMSQLKKYHPDPSHIIEPEEVELYENLTYKVKPEWILDVRDKQTRNKTIKVVKAFWKGLSLSDATWEIEEWIQCEYPYLFSW
ncbi:uncharacterized protein LOC114755380 [Neltuma alba]|uniref:uncharacterized protein LOC114755380 n=1 Tax=Neltuma alba TaxID=207710 RepID=UPI0010A4CF75|nr:uncharacterized protein LOC114755380 [Prosopis alba]